MSLLKNSEALALALLMPISTVAVLAYLYQKLKVSFPEANGSGQLADAQDTVLHSVDIGLNLAAIASDLQVFVLVFAVVLGAYTWLMRGR